MSYPRIYIFEAFKDSFSLGGSRDITALSAPFCDWLWWHLEYLSHIMSKMKYQSATDDIFNHHKY